jgi:hypothetical protein
MTTIRLPFPPDPPVARCPHCSRDARLTPVHLPDSEVQWVRDVEPRIEKRLEAVKCPLCKELTVVVYTRPLEEGDDPEGPLWRDPEVVYPATDPDPVLPAKVPSNVSAVFVEASRVRARSDRAAAVLLRWCLQLALHAQEFPGKDLFHQIDAAKGRVPSRLWTKLHYVRKVGQYAAHPTDATGSGTYEQLLEVHPGEVEALFAALREFFEEMWARPDQDAEDLERLNKKLTAAGLQPLDPPDGE